MTIDDIIKEVDENGYANLTDDDINLYISYRTDIALRDAKFEAEIEAIRQQSKAASDAYRAAAQASFDEFQRLVRESPKPVVLDFKEA